MVSVSVRNVGQPDNTGVSVNCPFTAVEAFVGRGKLRGHVVRGLRDGLRSSVTGVELVELLLLRINRNQLRHFRHLTRMSPQLVWVLLRGNPACTQDTLQRFHLSTGLI